MQQSSKPKDLLHLRKPIQRVNPSKLLLLQSNDYLAPFHSWFEEKYNRFHHLINQIESNEGSFYDFATSYHKMGFNETTEGVWYREWAPAAQQMSLYGDFNNWNPDQYPLKRNQYGVWEIFIPRNKDGAYPIFNYSKLKVHILDAQDNWVDKIPAWIHYAGQSPSNVTYDGLYISQQEDNKYKWQHDIPAKPKAPKIYEAHIGMSSIEPKVATYREFRENVLPRIKTLGYNTIQLMGIMEHPYYASYGYHVTNYFAISSRFGTINELKELIDAAHSMGIYVLIDIVHSHASSNEQDGLSMFDGTNHQYFHGGERGYHTKWDSLLFDYSKWEVLRFLLSNLAWYLEEYRFDGFRFDGVTSMMYTHHGIDYDFTGNPKEYFSSDTDMDAVIYLTLANTIIHRIRPDAITIAEDVSGMPGLCRPVEEGGCGFDYRLSMGVPDNWIRLMKHVKDEDWDMNHLVNVLTNRRPDEKCISYVESHDQALVGDKTLAMWLFDAEIYTNMSVLQEETITGHRGLALHKMIRLITLALGGEGYLNFMGNEFGHPEWIDFPHDGNHYSHNHCRRQWNLADNEDLYYYYFNQFDKAMIHLEDEFQWLSSHEATISQVQEENKVLAFERGGLLWIFNFHPTQSFEDYLIGTWWPYEHQIVLDTDEARFVGKDRLRPGHEKPFLVIKEEWSNRPNHLKIYLPSRTALALKPVVK